MSPLSPKMSNKQKYQQPNSISMQITDDETRDLWIYLGSSDHNFSRDKNKEHNLWLFHAIN